MRLAESGFEFLNLFLRPSATENCVTAADEFIRHRPAETLSDASDDDEFAAGHAAIVEPRWGGFNSKLVHVINASRIYRCQTSRVQRYVDTA